MKKITIGETTSTLLRITLSEANLKPKSGGISPVKYSLSVVLHQYNASLPAEVYTNLSTPAHVPFPMQPAVRHVRCRYSLTYDYSSRERTASPGRSPKAGPSFHVCEAFCFLMRRLYRKMKRTAATSRKSTRTDQPTNVYGKTKTYVIKND